MSARQDEACQSRHAKRDPELLQMTDASGDSDEHTGQHTGIEVFTQAAVRKDVTAQHTTDHKGMLGLCSGKDCLQPQGRGQVHLGCGVIRAADQQRRAALQRAAAVHKVVVLRHLLHLRPPRGPRTRRVAMPDTYHHTAREDAPGDRLWSREACMQNRLRSVTQEVFHERYRSTALMPEPLP